MAPELVVMAGLQAAGRRTPVLPTTRRLAAGPCTAAWPNARRREARQRRVVAELLAEGRSVVVDNTNPTAEERAPLVAAARAAGVAVRAVWLDTPLAVCAGRNDAREGRARVPPAGLYETAARFVPPSLAEGFDRVDLVPTG
ncbi:AAA family ATPase [Geodermatophilus sp. CPCC 206100]|uniref:AAA family ATPase n=1 Tax=Geodermatophilus sp. CPCC 206100 TaxID=3020054 RepID=UPI003AFFDC8F